MNVIQSFLVVLLSLFTFPGISQNSVIIHADKPGSKIDKAIYGQFAEHLGHCIYGGIYVGEKSDIPNTKGFRLDVVGALKELKVPLVRWPGGCFADTYHWKDGIGPKADRPSIINVHWGGVTEDNSFGTHEFLDFCELIGADAYVCLNVGSGTVSRASINQVHGVLLPLEPQGRNAHHAHPENGAGSVSDYQGLRLLRDMRSGAKW